MGTDPKTPAAALPTDKEARKNIPMMRGLLDYFPAALAAVAEVSRVGNEQHNPGEPMHHARGKSMDHADCVVRHLLDRGTVDTDGLRHTAKAAWRVLALLQEELEAAGAPLARAARLPEASPSAGEADSKGIGGWCGIAQRNLATGKVSVCWLPVGHDGEYHEAAGHCWRAWPIQNESDKGFRRG